MTIQEVVDDYEAMKREDICACAVKLFASNILGAIKRKEVSWQDLYFSEFDVRVRLIEAIRQRVHQSYRVICDPKSSVNDFLCAVRFIKDEVANGQITWKQLELCPRMFNFIVEEGLNCSQNQN